MITSLSSAENKTIPFESEMEILIQKMRILTINDVSEEMETNSASSDKAKRGKSVPSTSVLSSLKGKKLCKDIYGNTPFHDAANLGNFNQLQSLILRYKIDIDDQNKEGSSVLQLAVSAKCAKCVYLILSSSPNLNLRDIDGFTALHWAAFSNNADLEIIKTLLEKDNIDLTVRDNKGRTPEEYARSLNSIHFLDALSRHEKLNKRFDTKSNVRCVGRTRKPLD